MYPYTNCMFNNRNQRHRWFEEEGSLERLPRAHLMRLVKSCNTVSPLKKVAALFVPKALLVALLRKEALSIRYCNE